MQLFLHTQELYVIFRRIFDKLPDKATHEAALLDVSDEWMEVELKGDISTDDEALETFSLSESCMNGVSSIEIKKVYEVIAEIK